jgi:hypothetical protein
LGCSFCEHESSSLGFSASVLELDGSSGRNSYWLDVGMFIQEGGMESSFWLVVVSDEFKLGSSGII